ncbi:unnamed protein product [Alopecurus aequalis]
MDADSWPALPGQLSPAPPTTPPPPKASSPKAAAAAPVPPPTVAVISPVSVANSGAKGAVISPVSVANSGAKGAVISPLSLGNYGTNPGDDVDALLHSPPVRRALVMLAGDDGLVTPARDDGLVACAPAPELSPVYSPNARSNGGGGYHNQNGRFGSHPHDRNGGYGGGNRRGSGGGGGGRHGGHEYRGGFDGQRRSGGRSRDGHGPGHQQRGGHQPSYTRASPPPVPVIAAAPPPPFVGSTTPQTPPYGAPPMAFPAEMAPHVYYFAVPTSEGLQALPFMPPPPPTPPAMVISPLEQLQRELLVQIDYYFSDENLCKDIYLRGHMDDQGWVPVSLIAGFKKVQMLLHRIGQVNTLTNNFQFILDTMLLSTVVEVQGDKIRRRARWEMWLLRRSNQSSRSSSSSQSPVTSNIDSLASQFQYVGLEGTRYHPTGIQGIPSEALLTRSATSASIGYQVPAFGGLHSNGGSGPIFGQQTARSLLRSDTF